MQATDDITSSVLNLLTIQFILLLRSLTSEAVKLKSAIGSCVANNASTFGDINADYIQKDFLSAALFCPN